jgi:hypothetical protein
MGMKRSHGSGHLDVKWGSYHGRWRGADGRLINKKIGEVRRRGDKNGITRAEAERGLRRLVEAEFQRPVQAAEVRTPTVDEVTNELRECLATVVPQGAGRAPVIGDLSAPQGWRPLPGVDVGRN